MRLRRILLWSAAFALLGSCDGEKDTADDSEDSETVDSETDTVDSETEPETDGDTDTLDTVDSEDTEDTVDTDTLDTDTTPPHDSSGDSAAVDTFDPNPPDTSIVPQPGETGDSGDSSGGCGPLEVADCDGTCVLASLVGDGVCQQGQGGGPNLDCVIHDQDGGDCAVDTDTLPCGQPLTLRDCNGTCYAEGWIGDGNCDDGTTHVYGSPDYSCELFDFDEGDCNGVDPIETDLPIDTDPVDTDLPVDTDVIDTDLPVDSAN